jgi:Adenylate and Guanylate cyclase catalytic domain
MVFQAHRRTLERAVEAEGGEVLEWTGDGTFAAFTSVADALRCAITMQQGTRLPVKGARLQIRVGVHTGEALARRRLLRDTIVIARRLCDRAEAGQIHCSAAAAGLLSSRQSFSFRSLGEAELKGITAPLTEGESPAGQLVKVGGGGSCHHRRAGKRIGDTAGDTDPARRLANRCHAHVGVAAEKVGKPDGFEARVLGHAGVFDEIAIRGRTRTTDFRTCSMYGRPRLETLGCAHTKGDPALGRRFP